MAELAAALSVVTDAARGLQEGQGIRSCVLALHLAQHLDLPDDDRATLFWVGLLRFAGWTAADSAIPLAPAARSDLVRKAAPEQAAHRTATGQVSQVIAGRFGMAQRVVQAVGQVFERWDGSGLPGERSGAEIDAAVRLWQVAHTCDLIASTRGAGRWTVASALRLRAGRSLDPTFAKATARAAGSLPIGSAAGIDELLALEPAPVLLLDRAGVDAVLPVFGMIADFAAPYLDGHSDRVSRLAADAAAAAGLAPHDVMLLRRAGWVHDVGRVAVPARVWTSDQPLPDAELTQLRQHPAHSARLLGHTPGLAALAPVVATHHERLDGTGYPAGGRGELTRTAGLLAAADTYVSAGERRPHRAARPPAEQAYLLLGLARDGALPHEAVDAVIAAVNASARR